MKKQFISYGLAILAFILMATTAFASLSDYDTNTSISSGSGDLYTLFWDAYTKSSQTYPAISVESYIYKNDRLLTITGRDKYNTTQVTNSGSESGYKNQTASWEVISYHAIYDEDY